jgi:hypothetical protein
VLTQTIDHISGGLNVACLDLMVAEGQDLQKGHRFQGLFVALYVLYDHFGLAVLGDNKWFPLRAHIADDFGGVGLQVADRFDLT